MGMSRNMIAFSAAGAALGMLALSFAAKPLYETFCQVTGFGGTTRIADAPPAAVLDRTVSVRFDANVAPGLPLTFRALETSHLVHVGETALAFYEVTNTSDRPVAAVASYNVTPHKTGPYFSKLECFCFETRVFAPGETARLPVVFFVNPLMNDERQLNDVSAITLSYTFFESDDPAGTIQPGRPQTLPGTPRPVSAAQLGASPAGELAYKSGETRIEREEG